MVLLCPARRSEKVWPAFGLTVSMFLAHDPLPGRRRGRAGGVGGWWEGEGGRGGVRGRVLPRVIVVTKKKESNVFF